MSNHLAVATVTAALKHLVEVASNANVVVGRPTAAVPDAEPKVHLYLYQVSSNAAFRGADLPTRNAEGRLVQRPQAALDLHYLISFYGDNTVFEPDLMLGAVVRDLHAHPLLGRAAIRNAIQSNGALTASNLDSAVEHVKFSPAHMSLDELTKLWSMMIQVPHVLSVAYVGTVVLIEAEETPSAPLPVLRRGQDDRGVDTRLGPFPRLSDVWIGVPSASARRPRPASLPSAQLGARLLFAGADLGGDELRLRFTHVPVRRADGTIEPIAPREIAIPPADRPGAEIRMDLPDDAAAQTAWPAGIYGVSAIVVRGSVTYPATGALALALAPHVTAIAPNPAARDATKQVVLQVTCRPRVLAAQAAQLVFADRETPAEPFAGTTDVLTFVVKEAPLTQGTLVRLRVDGVDSLPFTFDDANGGIAFDDQQRVTIQ